MHLLFGKIKADVPAELNKSALNSLGYRMIRNDNVNEALKIFKLNILIHPDYNMPYSCHRDAEKVGEKIDKYLSIKKFNFTL